MEELIKKTKVIGNELLLISIALICIGIYLIIEPIGAQVVLCRIIGALLIVWGILRIISFFTNYVEAIFSSFGLVQGITLILFGFFFIVDPVDITAFFGIMLAIVILANGILMVQYAIELKKLRVKEWWIEILAGILMIALGVIAIIDPFTTTSSLMIFIGIVLIYGGIVGAISIIRIKSLAKQLKKDVKDIIG